MFLAVQVRIVAYLLECGTTSAGHRIAVLQPIPLVILSHPVGQALRRLSEIDMSNHTLATTTLALHLVLTRNKIILNKNKNGKFI